MNFNAETRALLTHFIKVFNIQQIDETDIERFMNIRKKARQFDIPRDIYGNVCEFLAADEIVNLSITCKTHISYDIETWRAIMMIFFPRSTIKLSKNTVSIVKEGVQYWLFYSDYVGGIRKHIHYTNLMKHEKGMVWLSNETMLTRNNITAFRTNMSDYRSREREASDMFDKLCDKCKNTIDATHMTNVRDMSDIPYYTQKKEPDMRLYGYHPDEKEQSLIDICDEHRKWLTFEYDSETDTDTDDDEYEDQFYYTRGGTKYRIRPSWIDPTYES